MKEYQIRMEGYRLPEEVYHQCLWIVRDMERSIGLLPASWLETGESCHYKYPQQVIESVQYPGHWRWFLLSTGRG